MEDKITASDALTMALGHLNALTVQGAQNVQSLAAACQIITAVIQAIKREEAAN